MVKKTTKKVAKKPPVQPKSYERLKLEMADLQKQLNKAKQAKKAEALKTVRKLVKEFGITDAMLEGYTAKGRTRVAKVKDS